MQLLNLDSPKIVSTLTSAGNTQLINSAGLNLADVSTFQTTGQVIDDISDDAPPTSSDLSEFESSESMPFRRDLDAAVADNIDILLEPKDVTTTNGFVDFAKAVARSINYVKRSFPKYCGNHCIKKRSPLPAAIPTLAPAYCGHHCIKKRAALQAAAAAAKRDGGSEEYCGKDCKNGPPDTSAIKTSAHTPVANDTQGEGESRYCGHHCIMKRALRSLLQV